VTEEVLFHAVLAQPPADRAAYLTAHCPDPDRRRKVEDLLAAHDRAGGVLDAPVNTGPFDATTTGTVIGPYKLLQRIGEGGMGAVWMAEQDQPVRRRVALKLIKPGMDSAQVIARFEAERQALALMDHQNIARVFDVGTVPPGAHATGLAGKPYFVMELIRGEPITNYCDANHLTPQERLELFVPVCQAVQHAHQKGVIHRDLKPSNVLVTLYDGRPVPKVIDFGVAKALHQRLTDKTMFTEFGAAIGTLEYMAPEQAELSHLDVDTRSDIYSLGVLLYELLTGSTPLDRKRLRSAAYDEMLRMIREEEPPKPSTRLSQSGEKLPSIAAQRRTEPAKLSKLVRGEIDWIVMKALEKDRGRRYETANSFARDVQRYLADEPVEACPPTAGYRVRKFVRRNKGPVLTAAAFVALLTVAAVVSIWQAVQATRAEQTARAAATAEREAKKMAEKREAETSAVLEFVQKRIFGGFRPAKKKGRLDREITLRQALESALPFVRPSFVNQPLIEARIRRELGKSFYDVYEPGIAAEQLETAGELYARHLGPNHPDTLRTTTWLAKSYYLLGRLADARRLYEKTLALQKAELGPDHPDTLESMAGLAGSHVGLGSGIRPDEGLRLWEETVALSKARFGPDDPSTLRYMDGLASAYSFHDYGAYLKLLEEMLAVRKAKLGLDHPDTLLNMQNLANCYGEGTTDAIKLREQVLMGQKALLGRDHADTFDAMNDLAKSYAAAGRYADALKLHEQTLANYKSHIGPPDHPDVLENIWYVATELSQLGRGAEAVPIIDDCVRRAAGKQVEPRLVLAVMELRLRHFEKAKDAAGCRQTAEMWENLNRTDATSLYNAACFRAVASAVLRQTPGVDATRLAHREADRAIAWLRKAIAAGYSDIPQLLEDPDLAALRGRSDYADLLWDLADVSAPLAGKGAAP
jgi:serine/threonine protein kinase/tetratricopeptide (TPR) repeat protein